MTSDKNTSFDFGKGLVMGGIIGAVASYFLSPKSGKENRRELAKKVNNMVENTKEAGEELYDKAQKEINKRIADIKEDIDEKKYMDVVDDVINNIKRTAANTTEKIEETRKKLMKDWSKKQTSRK